jgi:hypothetical protein
VSSRVCCFVFLLFILFFLFFVLNFM